MTGVIVAGGINIKNAAWSPVEKTTGEYLYEWTLVNNFIIPNAQASPPSLSCDRGRSWVDHTMFRSVNIVEWKVEDEDTLSDHQMLSFCIPTGGL